VALAAWAEPYVGLPFAPHGRTRQGVDCYGLVALVLAEVFGQALPPYDYAHQTDWDGIEDAVQRGLRDWRRVAPADARVGDGVVLRLRGRPLHVGLLVDLRPLTMLHVLDRQDACCQPLDTPTWVSRLVGIFRWQTT
jgi:lipoprotein Spr